MESEFDKLGVHEKLMKYVVHSSKRKKFKKIYFSSHKLPKQQSTNFWFQGILGIKNDSEGFTPTMCQLFGPQCTFSNVKKYSHKSLVENFEQLYPSIPTFDKEIIKNINISLKCKESRVSYKFMQAYEVDNNEHTNCHKYEHRKIDGLCDENVVDEQDHIFDELTKIHNNINIEQTCTTSSYL